MELFRGHDGVHGTHGEPELDSNGLKWGIKKTADTRREPATLELWELHLAGERPLGIVPIREDGTCFWGGGDIDQYDMDMGKMLHKVYQSKLPLLPTRSKSGGLHLFAFFEEPMPCAVVQAMLRDMMASLGLAGCEIFPKQTQLLTERGDVGNWLVMPYYGDDFGGKLQQQVGLKVTGAEMTPAEYLAASERVKMSPEDIQAMGSRRRKKKVSEPFDDGPPCLQHMAANGFPEGSRNNALFMVGLYLKRREPSTWQQNLDEANRLHMRPPLSTDEVQQVVRSLEKRDYEYTCKTEPMCSHCDAAVCRGRRFGIGVAGEFPVISGLSKLDIPGDPIWFVDIAEHRVEASTTELQTFTLFQRVCMIQCNRMFRVMKQADWAAMVSEAMESLTVIEAPPDVGAPAQFRELLGEWLTNRMKGERKEDLLAGRPWLDPENGRHWFRIGDLQRFLQREGLREIGRGEISQSIRKLGGGRHYFNIKQRGVSVWWVEEDAFQGMPELEVPEMEDEPI